MFNPLLFLSGMDPAQFALGKIGILSLNTWMPLVGALILIFGINKAKEDTIKYFTTAWLGFCFVLSLPLVFMWKSGVPGLQFIENYQWIPMIGAKYQMGVDGLALVLVMLTTFIGFIAALCSWTYIETRIKEYYAFLLLLQTGMVGLFVSCDLFMFYIFFEIMLVPMYFIIGIWGGERRLYAAIKFFLYTLVGAVLMLLAIFKLYFLAPEVVKAHEPEVKAAAMRLASDRSGETHNTAMLALINDGIESAKAVGSDTPGTAFGTFNIFTLQAVGSARGENGLGFIPLALQLWLFAGFAIGFMIKVPMFPFHTWLPDAHVEAPTAGSAILAGILLKIGTYGFLRFNFPLFPDATKDPKVVGLMSTLAIIGIIYGSMVAIAQKDMKKLIAYSSVAHMGVCMLSMFALNPNGINGSVLQMLNHGITSSALFILVGIIYERRHTRQIAEYGGIAQVMPHYAVIFGITTMSSVGLPLLNVFVGEFVGLRGVFEANVTYAALATTTIVLGAVYMLWLYQRMFFGEASNPKNKGLNDLTPREWAYMLPLVALMFIVGIYPKPIVNFINGPTETIVQTVRRDYFIPKGGEKPEGEKRAEKPEDEKRAEKPANEISAK